MRKFLFWDECGNVVAVDEVSSSFVVSDIAHIRKVITVDTDGFVIYAGDVVNKVTILYMNEKATLAGL